jgi:uncharacterized protein
MKKDIIVLALLLLSLGSYRAGAQDPRTLKQPDRLVNDYASLLSADDVQRLESKLVAFDDSTSTQITVVIVSDLNGYDKMEYAHILGSTWKAGQKGKDNGAIILVKPKTEGSDGQVFIEPGYGLEGVIPDLVCNDIIEREMIPRFKENDYYGGINAATDVIMALASKEYSAADYAGRKHSSGKGTGSIAIIIVIILIFIISGASRNNNRHFGNRGASSIPWWMMMGAGGSSGSSWGGFSGGGGGGGGFGGFGGGSFGGGGAGGSW